MEGSADGVYSNEMASPSDLLDCQFWDGCIADTNEEIDEIRQAIPDGTPIEIKP